MSIIYYPDSVVKQKTHVVEKMQKPDILYSFRGKQNLAGSPLSVTCWSPRSWEIKTICVHFSNAIAKTYGAYVTMVAGVVSGKNDTLWIKPRASAPQLITIPQGAYDGTTLSAALKAQLDANAAFIAEGAVPFTVTYTAATGVFTIASSAGKLFSYLNVNSQVPVRRESPAGHVLGFTVDSAEAATVASDTSVMGLGDQTMYFGGATSTDTNVVATDPLSMTSDNTLVLTSSIVAAWVNYEVVYKILDA